MNGAVRLHAARAAGLACGALACLNVGLTPGETLSALGLLVVGAWPLGRLATARLLAGRLSSGERRALELLCGYVALALVYLAAARLRLTALVPWVLAGAAVWAVWTWRRAVPPLPAARVPAGVACVLWLALPLALLALTRGNRAFVPLSDGSVVFNHSIDHAWHLGMYAELQRGVPPAELPVVAGLAFPSYHVASFMPGLFLVEQGGFDEVGVYFGVQPLVRLALVAAGLFLAVRLRTGDAWLAAGAVPFALLTVHAVEQALYGRGVDITTTVYFLMRSESGGGGLVVWGLVFTLLAGVRGATDEDAGRTIRLAATLAGLSFGFKAQLFLLLGGALAAALLARAAWAVDRRARRDALGALGLLAASSGLAYAAAWRPGALGALRLEPGLLVAQYVYPLLERDGWAAVRALAETMRAWPAGLGALTLVPFVLWRVVVFSPIVPVFVARTLARLPRAAIVDAAAALAFLLALPLCHALALVSIEREPSPFEFLQAAHGLALLGAAVSVMGLGVALGRWTREPGRAVLLAGLPLAALAGVHEARSPAFVPPRSAITLSADEQCALLWLRAHTAADAVVVSARSDAFEASRGGRLNHQPVVAGFAGRRAVFEYHPPQVDPTGDRAAAIRRLFRTRKPRVARSILDRYGVDYVLEYAGGPLHSAGPFLTEVYRRGDVRVLRYPRPGRPAPGRDRGRPRPWGGLRCE